jgi:hypothetical protein
MDVYEKPTGRSAWLLGLVALRELLEVHELERFWHVEDMGGAVGNQCRPMP